MHGSLAIWCESEGSNIDGQTPQIELHFNIWRDLPKGVDDIFDFRILFQDARTIKRLYISIPAAIDKTQIVDLSSILEDRTTLSAVFNDTLDVGPSCEESCTFAVVREGGGSRVAFFVCRIDEKSDLVVNQLTSTGERRETVIELTETFFERLRDEVGDHYVRLRIGLRDHLSSLFVTDIEPSDRIFLSSFYRSQTIEFRLNEKRNFSDALRQAYPAMQMPAIKVIQYFLVRDLRVEMVQAHTAFRKMRRLESGLWNNYLKNMGSPDPHNMIIYHWRVERESDTGTIEDFIALAAFKKTQPNLLYFLAAIVFLGAGGSAMQVAISAVVASLSPPGVQTAADTFVQQLVVIAIVLVFLGALVTLASGLRTRKVKRVRNILSNWFTKKH